MFDLLKFPDKIMLAKTGDKFLVGTKPFVFESTGTECFLTTDEDDGGEWENWPNEDSSYPWKHVRHKLTGSAVFTRKSLVDVLVSGEFEIN